MNAEVSNGKPSGCPGQESAEETSPHRLTPLSEKSVEKEEEEDIPYGIPLCMVLLISNRAPNEQFDISK